MKKTKLAKHAAVYVRVSSTKQEHRSQLPDLERWVESQNEPVKFYHDKFTGTTMDRPGWNQLEADMRAGKVSKIVCWKLDRLGRTACELLTLRDELRERKVDLICVISGMMGLNTPEGRAMFNMVATFAEYEREIRLERQMAGIAVAKKKGVYKGRKKGTTKATPQRALELREQGLTADEIAKSLGVTRNTVFRYLREVKS